MTSEERRGGAPRGSAALGAPSVELGMTGMRGIALAIDGSCLEMREAQPPAPQHEANL